MLVNITPEEAQQQILNHSRLLSEEQLPLLEAANRISSREIIADTNLPPYAQSAVDGYALAEKPANGKDTYWLNGYLKANDNTLVPIQEGQAVGVFTGGNIPLETWAVVPHERTITNNNHMQVTEIIKAGNNIKKVGEDYAQGDQLVARASLLTPAHLSLLAAYGQKNVVVYRKPQIAVLSLSGNVVPVDMIPAPGQIRDSNGPLLGALIQKDGGTVVSMQTSFGKTRLELKRWALSILDQIDVMVVIGGTYAATDNEARLLMEEIGAKILYWGVDIQPGSHTGASLLDSRLIIGLSGNPAACAVGYQLFVAPALRAMQGLSPYPKYLTAICSNGFPKKTGSRRFVRGQADWNENGLQVTVLPGQKPSMIRSLFNCNALIDLPAGSPPVEAGSNVSILWLDSTF
ncbi:MoeA, N-terminal and linker domain [Syntrophomonas zehnderi OL-4]|uniref:Molybdopterin molybdenumtransferase n=1 Tax=Syntrophomonas zehnderi OL-4 TaxID=690567 RepID=A0A0E4C9P3_9FIRM|nr:molybdopterin molybdotransferase MoeA [Syntrophomonas zehnderi]CFY06150.1 MoeA, N-terminal and linker domain [Syntrophomonas zehnderi OL-4]